MQPPKWLNDTPKVLRTFYIGDNYEFAGSIQWLELETSSVLKTCEEPPSMAGCSCFVQPHGTMAAIAKEALCLGRESFFK